MKMMMVMKDDEDDDDNKPGLRKNLPWPHSLWPAEILCQTHFCMKQEVQTNNLGYSKKVKKKT